MATRVRSYSKINLGLAVGPLRADGFHGLTTIYQTLELHDFVTVTAREAGETRILLKADHVGVPRTETGDAEKNTAFVMVDKALRRMGLRAEVEIRIEKRLPVQGGMGAGSANAVAALVGLEVELGGALVEAERLELAAEVGSDVPLFLVGGTVLGLGRGEQVSALPDLPMMHCVVAVPKVGVSTKLAFAELDRRQSALTFAQGEGRLEQLSRVLAAVRSMDGAAVRSLDGASAGPTGIARAEVLPTLSDLAENPLLALVRTGIENDFEEVAFSQHPSLRSTKRDLVGSDSDPGKAVYACLSGSGSALFGLYESQADAREAQRRVLAGGTDALLTKTLTRKAYWDTMFAE